MSNIFCRGKGVPVWHTEYEEGEVYSVDKVPGGQLVLFCRWFRGIGGVAGGFYDPSAIVVSTKNKVALVKRFFLPRLEKLLRLRGGK